MRRRAFIATVLGYPAAVFAAPVVEPLPPENAFSHAYNEWLDAHVQEHYEPALNIRAIRLWAEVERTWGALRKHVKEVVG